MLSFLHARLGALWCASWPGWCARCQLWICQDRAEAYGEIVITPKPSTDYLCRFDVGDEGWGADW